MSEIYIFGTCIGLKSKEKPPVLDKNTNQMMVPKDWHIGISVPKEGGFDGETETLSIKVNDKMQAAGLLAVYTEFRGKRMAVPVKPFPYSQRGGDSAAISWQLAGDGQPRSAPVMQPLTLKPASTAAAG